jgi:hypothetical protein
MRTARVVALAILIAVVTVGCGKDGAPASPSPLPGLTGTVATAIPDAAFLQPVDTYRDKPQDGTSDRMLPPLCDASFPSDASITARRTVDAPYRSQPPSDPAHPATPAGTIIETITVYGPGGASAFMSQLRAATLACPTQQVEGQARRNRILTAPRRGDESFLIEARYPGHNLANEPTGEDEFRLVSVIRDGDRVLVLFEISWEGGSSLPSALDRLSTAALAHLRAWHG